MTKWTIPSVVEHDGVLEVNIGWHGGGYHNESLRPAARIAVDRCKPLFKAWSRRAVGFGMALEELIASCYLQGVTDGIAAADKGTAAAGEGAHDA